MQPLNPNPSSSHVTTYSYHLTTTHYSSYYPHHLQAPTSNPNPQLPILHHPYTAQEPLHYNVSLGTGLDPPGIDPYSNLSSFAHSDGGGYGVQQSGDGAYAQYQAVSTDHLAGSYYLDPNAIATAAIPYATSGTIPPNGTKQLVPAISNSTLWTNPTNRPYGTWKKGPKKTKVVQSVWCEVCKIDCNAKDVLEQHKLGKKHKKNLDKLREASKPAPLPVASAASVNPVIGPLENPAKSKSISGQKSKKKAADSLEVLETKRRKVLEGGAEATAVRICAICNVICNSETVFKQHIAGQKHTALTKEHASRRGLAAA